jgi:hypothetical protein
VFSIIGNFLYWVDYRKLTPSAYQNGYEQTLRADMLNFLRIFNDKECLSSDTNNPAKTKYSVLGVNGDGSWRSHVLDLCHIIPLMLLCIDMLINKIRIPVRQLFITFWLIIIWLSTVYIYYLSGFGNYERQKFPIYQSNLNFECETNWSFLYANN